jgi:hypothetical protein
MNILDVASMINIDRFRKININADSPEEVYAGTSDDPEDNTQFLQDCINRMPLVRFADPATGSVYLRMEDAMPVWCDPEGLDRAVADPVTAAGLRSIGIEGSKDIPSAGTPPARFIKDETDTLGAWS